MAERRLTPRRQNAMQCHWISEDIRVKGVKASCVVVAAGRGRRMGAGIPKAYASCAGKPLLAWTLEALAKAPDIDNIIVVIHDDDNKFYQDTLATLSPATAALLTAPVAGGATRQQSVRAGLEALARSPRRPDIVLIHDAARPFPTPALIARAIAAAQDSGAAVPALRLVDALKSVGADGVITGPASRDGAFAVQTPQAFAFDLILAAHRDAATKRADNYADDAEAAAAAGAKVRIFDGEAENFKVTSAQDLSAAEAKLIGQSFDIRIGQGFDVHAFAPGDHVMLCGVRIAHPQTLLGHSDADVALHAIADAIYGAIGEGDIGVHFPPSDPQWRGAPSSVFIAHAAARVQALGGLIGNIDVTLICEAPKISGYREAMRAAVAGMLGIGVARVGVKATTSEGLGFTGRREGVACLASALVRLPWR